MSPPAKRSKRKFIVRTVEEERAEAILRFHKENRDDEFLWSRDLNYFEKRIAEGSLYEVVEVLRRSEEIVGFCYIALETELDAKTPRSELGGIYIRKDCRPLGLPSVICKAAIIDRFVWAPPSGRLIAHVHPKNNNPLNLLTMSLGFKHVGQETIPGAKVPKEVKLPRNDDGDLVGLLFEFQRAQLLAFAQWLEDFSGTIKKNDVESSVTIDMAIMINPKDSAQALRERAKL